MSGVVEVVAAILVRDGRIFLQQRPPTKDFAWCWESPGGKVEPSESHHVALRRELREELGIDIGELPDGQKPVWTGRFENLVTRPKHDGPTTTHVLFEGQPLCGFMAGQLPKDWPAGHNWVSIADVVWGDGKAYIPNDSQRLEDPRPCPGCCDRVASSLVLQDAVGGRWR